MARTEWARIRCVRAGAGKPGDASQPLATGAKLKGISICSAFDFSTKEKTMIGKVCMVRTYSAGVFLGKLEERNGKEVRLTNARRMYYWDGAASLSQLATMGTSKPKTCKFPAPVAEVLLTEAIEIIPATEAAIASIAAVKEWAL